MDDLLVDSGHLQAHICKEAVETGAAWLSQKQASLSFALPPHADLLFTLPSTQLSEGENYRKLRKTVMPEIKETIGPYPNHSKMYYNPS